jgi:TonB-dependent SusC/RagA subfamily outer membrane receptor
MPSPLVPTTLLIVVLSELAAGCASGSARAPERVDESTVSAEDIEKNPNLPIERILQAKSPGLLIKRADDGSIIVLLRGAHSFTGTDAPLYVVDGLTFRPGPDGVLSGIDPLNIESIKVVRGSEAALYGIEGMNGVIAITTKKPEKRVR